MKELSFAEAMEIIYSNENLTDHMKNICRILSETGIGVNRKDIDSILLKCDINYKDIKEDLLDIILAYARLIIKDGIISQNESFNLKYLKRLFKIKEGYFFNFRNQEIKEIIQSQLFKLYFDNTIDSKEALYKVGLQELFDLSFDQMATFVNPVADEAIERGAEISDLDTVFPNYKISRSKSKSIWKRIIRRD